MKNRRQRAKEEREARIEAARKEGQKENRKYARGKEQIVAAAQRAASLGLIKEVDTFADHGMTEVLVQCWDCGFDEHRQFGIGRADELRCRHCNGKVEVLT